MQELILHTGVEGMIKVNEAFLEDLKRDKNYRESTIMSHPIVSSEFKELVKDIPIKPRRSIRGRRSSIARPQEPVIPFPFEHYSAKDDVVFLNKVDNQLDSKIEEVLAKFELLLGESEGALKRSFTTGAKVDDTQSNIDHKEISTLDPIEYMTLCHSSPFLTKDIRYVPEPKHIW